MQLINDKRHVNEVTDIYKLQVLALIAGTEVHPSKNILFTVHIIYCHVIFFFLIFAHLIILHV